MNKFMNKFLVSLTVSSVISFSKSTPHDVGLNILELVPKHGYKLESHFITTEDGYILETHRISKPNLTTLHPPVLAVQGISLSSVDWINGGPKKSLVYALVDLGFDLWLANNRGTRFGRHHETLNPDVDRKFWDFSFHELGYYDNPALIDYILGLENTKWKKLIYLGLSQGCTNFFVMNSERPEYNDKILLAHMLAPVAFFGNTVSPPIRYLLPAFERPLVLQNIHLTEFLPRSVNDMFWPTVCTPNSLFFPICRYILNLLVGINDHQLEDDIIPIVTSNVPAGGSLKQYLHYSQLVKSGRFCKFDYRSHRKNVQVYGQAVPTEYNLTKVTAPVTSHYGSDDWLLNEKDAIKTTSMLPNVVLNNKIKYRRFTHANFLWVKDGFDILYDKIIKITLQYVKNATSNYV